MHSHAAASVKSKMATMQHKVFCVREFIKTESATAVQRAFRLCFNVQPPTRKSICCWYHQFLILKYRLTKLSPSFWITLYMAGYLKFYICCIVCLRWEHECTHMLLVLHLTTMSSVWCIQGYQVERPCFLQWVDPTLWKEHPNLLPE